MRGLSTYFKGSFEFPEPFLRVKLAGAQRALRPWATGSTTFP